MIRTRALAAAMALAIASLAAPVPTVAAATDAAQAPAETAAARLHALFEADWQRRLRENPLMARSGARRSCEMVYEKDSSSRTAASSAAVRSSTRCSSVALSLPISSSWRTRSVMSRRITV